MYYNFLVSEALQGTHMNAIYPFNSKLMTLNPRGGLWTFSAILSSLLWDGPVELKVGLVPTNFAENYPKNLWKYFLEKHQDTWAIQPSVTLLEPNTVEVLG